MSPKIRKFNAAKRKQTRKDAKKKMEEQMGLFAKHPTECCLCNTAFERTHETVKTWHVVIREERVRLTCPECWGTFTEALEKVSREGG
jgi:hypothetical protein